MFYLIGLGLGDEKDITIKGLEAIKSCDLVYLESYTSLLGFLDWTQIDDANVNESAHSESDTACEMTLHTNESTTLLFENNPGFSNALAKMEEFYGKKLLLADRLMIESAAHPSLSLVGPKHALSLEMAKEKNVALLVVGDPLGATTHTDLLLRCQSLSVPTRVIHNTSIMTAVGITGLFLYHFGPTVSIPFFTESWKPASFYDKLAKYKKEGYHTLCLLDIKVKEPTQEELARGKQPKKWLPPRFMTVNQAIAQLLEVEQEKQGQVATAETLGIGLARLGNTASQVIAVGPLGLLKDFDFGPPLHSLIIPANLDQLHELEKDMLRQYLVPNASL